MCPIWDDHLGQAEIVLMYLASQKIDACMSCPSFECIDMGPFKGHHVDLVKKCILDGQLCQSVLITSILSQMVFSGAVSIASLGL